MEMLLFFFLVPDRLLWRNEWSQHWKSVEECCSYFLLLYFVFSLVPERSQVIALRRS
jgi:ABC-type transport system involved in cytochrome c biogenesis permease subunit